MKISTILFYHFLWSFATVFLIFLRILNLPPKRVAFSGARNVTGRVGNSSMTKNRNIVGQGPDPAEWWGILSM